MKLVDADKLLYHKRKVMFFGLGQDDECWGFAVPVEEIDKAPTISAVPVVMCQECKHYHADTGWCDQLSYFQTSDGEPCSPAESMDWKMFQENDYCSMGQRKEADHEVS